DVLVDDDRVLYRHLPAREGDDASTQLDVVLVERCAAELLARRGRFRRIRHGGRSLAAEPFGCRGNAMRARVQSGRSKPSRSIAPYDCSPRVVSDVSGAPPGALFVTLYVFTERVRSSP